MLLLVALILLALLVAGICLDALRARGARELTKSERDAAHQRLMRELRRH